MEHLYVKSGDPSCIGIRVTVWKNRDTDTAAKKLYPVTAIGVGIQTAMINDKHRGHLRQFAAKLYVA